MAHEIRADLVKFASDSELLIDRVYTSKIDLTYTSTLREIESISIRPETYQDLLKFIQPGIYSSDWYRRQQSIGDSMRSVSSRFRGRLRILRHLASLQVRVIEYPTSTEAILELLVEPGLGEELLQECADHEPEITNDMIKCIDSIVWPLIQGTEVLRGKTEVLRGNTFTESGGFLASFRPLNGLGEYGLGESLRDISFRLNRFIQELTTCLLKLSDESLVEFSGVDAAPDQLTSLGQFNFQDNLRMDILRMHIQSMAEELQKTLPELEEFCCDDEKECCDFAQDLKSSLKTVR